MSKYFHPEAKEQLHRVRNLIQDPVHWTQGKLARDAHGYEVDPKSEEATCWCLVGACLKTSTNAWDNYAARALGCFNTELGLDSFNDYNSHQKVIELIDRAIAKCDAELQDV